MAFKILVCVITMVFGLAFLWFAVQVVVLGIREFFTSRDVDCLPRPENYGTGKGSSEETENNSGQHRIYDHNSSKPARGKNRECKSAKSNKPNKNKKGK